MTENARLTDSLADEDPRVLEVSREYLAALEAGGHPDRSAYLERYPELREVLRECLEGIELAQSLRPLAPQIPMPQPPLEPNASPLGDFQIVREIGRGGMGIVYEATQLSLGRRVALKVLPFAAALDAKQLQRFKTEAYAAAQLHHTHIVPVYAVGCERGMHFYAMQLIEGRSFADVISELRAENQSRGALEDEQTVIGQVNTVSLAGVQTTRDGLSARSSPRSTRDRDSFRMAARIAADVADALEYAHEAGVIHRDIKPANLLLDPRGAVWVTDFGLALVATDVGLTQTGEVLGTLRYMSPEQAAGRRDPVDHRTDVYSLGATLYELLTLQPLFPGQDRPALLNQILNEEPRPLRKLDLAIPIELETIVLKSLSKFPSERYATAGEMAEDLRRYLNEIPIQARRPTLFDRVRKWIRRHPAALIAALVLLVFGLIGLGVTTAIVAQEHSRTAAAYQRELQRAKEAEDRFRLARRVVDDMIELAEEELSFSPFQEGLRKRLLESAIGYYSELQMGTDPRAEAELAVTQARVKSILSDLASLQTDRQRFLLKEVSVLDDLGLSTEKRGQLAELIERLDEQHFDPFRGPFKKFPLDSQGMEQHIVELARANNVAFSAILSPEQLTRLSQIALQCQGPMVFREIDIAKSLDLTAAQKARIQTIVVEAIFRRDDPHRPDQRGGPRGKPWNDFRGRPPGEPRPGEHGPGEPRPGEPRPGEPRPGEPRPGERRHDGGSVEDRDNKVRVAMQDALATLTPEQLQKWKKMTGKPFQGPFFFPRHEGPPGPPRGGMPGRPPF